MCYFHNLIRLILLSVVLLLPAIAHAVDVLRYAEITDTIRLERPKDLNRYTALTDDDYHAVAEELGVEIAAIKAVVDIEAGRAHKGFYSPGLPIINFDMSMFRRMAKKRKINIAAYAKSHPVVFDRLRPSKYGSTQAAQYARFQSASAIDSVAAAEGTFWGMFQIGGFNWKICGCSSLDDFISRMSYSEREQLELFASFLKSTGFVRYLREKNWSAFARRYNGSSYASRRYHTRLAAAYKRHKNNE